MKGFQCDEEQVITSSDLDSFIWIQECFKHTDGPKHHSGTPKEEVVLKRMLITERGKKNDVRNPYTSNDTSRGTSDLTRK